MQHSKLHLSDHWHTQTSVLSLLQSPLAVSWQRFLPRKIFQLPKLGSSCQPALHNSCQLTTQLTWSQTGCHFTSNSLSSLHRLNYNWTLSITNYSTSLYSTELRCRPGVLAIYPLCRHNRKHRLQQSFYCCHWLLLSDRLDIISAGKCLPTVTKQRMFLPAIVA
jgi:hypothetical protein